MILFEFAGEVKDRQRLRGEGEGVDNYHTGCEPHPAQGTRLVRCRRQPEHLRQSQGSGEVRQPAEWRRGSRSQNQEFLRTDRLQPGDHTSPSVFLVEPGAESLPTEETRAAEHPYTAEPVETLRRATTPPGGAKDYCRLGRGQRAGQ